MHPITEPHQYGWLHVGTTHQIYWEASGNPSGKPVIFLHGGPGAGASARCRGFFNPQQYRIVLMDQRGCGRSVPHAAIEENTTWDLVADIEKLRLYLGIERWMVFGGSWGSTLALAYAQSHPEQVTELVLRGIFLCRPQELHWLYQQGASSVFPDYWQHFIAPIAQEKRHDMVAAYHELLFDAHIGEAERLKAASAWASWEASIIHLQPDEQTIADCADGHFALAFARIENHYFTHLGWLNNERALLANIDCIRHIPTVIVQGRYDMCTPPQSAWDLHQAFPEAKLHMVMAGHAAFEAPISQALVAATDAFARPV